MYVIAKVTKLGLKFHQVIGDYKTQTYNQEQATKYETEQDAKLELSTIKSKGYKVFVIGLMEVE